MDEGLREKLSKQGIFTTKLADLYNWGRKNSVWPMQFGHSLLRHRDDRHHHGAVRLARFGAEVFPALAASSRPDDRGWCRH